MLFNDIVNSQDYVASVMGLQMNKEYLWNGADSVQPKYSEENLNHRHFVHPKSNVDWPGIEPDPPQ